MSNVNNSNMINFQDAHEQYFKNENLRKFAVKFLSFLRNTYVCFCALRLSQYWSQGEKIGRIFAYGEIVYLRQFWKITKVAKIFGLL
jgi:hypothetical protein